MEFVKGRSKNKITHTLMEHLCVYCVYSIERVLCISNPWIKNFETQGQIRSEDNAKTLAFCLRAIEYNDDH